MIEHNKTISATIYPASKLEGIINVPGDKSISHRLAMLAAFSQGKSIIKGFLKSEDCCNTVRAFTEMKVKANYEQNTLCIEGSEWQMPQKALDMGNSGTSMRLLSGLLAAKPDWITTLTGDSSLSNRPMKRIKEPLELMGAQIELLGKDGRPPIKIKGTNLKAIHYPSPVASAQVKSCILLAALFAKGTTVYTEKLPTRDHTELLFSKLNISIKIKNSTIELEGYGAKGPDIKGRTWQVPGDFSSAAFWLVAASILKNSHITLKGVGLNPKRTALLNVLNRMGANVIAREIEDEESPEATGEINCQSSKMKGCNVGGTEIPNLIDELPITAVAAAFAEGTTVIKDASELRVKESDRIACMVKNIKLSGFDAEELPDGMIIKGGKKRKAATTVESFGDHRIAMSMAILALASDEPLTINNVGCVATSYPGFWDDIRKSGGKVELNYSN
jgi:3-phosphoshikimate 1-carboxyvinyltransferase